MGLVTVGGRPARCGRFGRFGRELPHFGETVS